MVTINLGLLNLFGYDFAVADAIGLRERKKQQTRQQIYEAARKLFETRGFDRVSVAEVARAADVSEVTVFNYFPTKEDLLYGGMEFFEEQLIEAVRIRPKGESAAPPALPAQSCGPAYSRPGPPGPASSRCG